MTDLTTLFEPLQCGDLVLPNRIFMAPMTRCRADEGRIPNEMMAQYYRQRASAGLIITEGTPVSPQAVGYRGVPGIWNAKQVAGWQKVTDAVHEVGGRIFCQLWHVGRISHPVHLDGELPVAPSAIRPAGRLRLHRPITNFLTPRALDIAEIEAIVLDFTRAAQNAKDAGFDGVELHAANGYLADQFLQTSTNQRTDRYGGSLENRGRFLLEVVDALIGVWGPGRVGVHLRPRGEEHDMGDADPRETFTYVARELGERGIAFMFVREIEGDDSLLPEMHRAFGGVTVANEEMDASDAVRLIKDRAADAIAFGRDYVANPDLIERLRNNLPLSNPDTSTMYTTGPAGYTDYPAVQPQ